MPGKLRALLILAWGLFGSLWARVTGRPTGLPLFEKNFAADRLPALSAADRSALPSFSGCIACGLCDAGEGERMTASRGAYPGLMQWVLASTRSMPDYDAAVRALEFLPDEVLAAKEGVCPARIPFRRLALFVREKAGEVDGTTLGRRTS